jgi:hypothetical protein
MLVSPSIQGPESRISPIRQAHPAPCLAAPPDRPPDFAARPNSLGFFEFVKILDSSKFRLE